MPTRWPYSRRLTPLRSRRPFERKRTLVNSSDWSMRELPDMRSNRGMLNMPLPNGLRQPSWQRRGPRNIGKPSKMLASKSPLRRGKRRASRSNPNTLRSYVARRKASWLRNGKLVRRNPAFFGLLPYNPVQLATLTARASRRQFTKSIALRPDIIEGQSTSPSHTRELRVLVEGPPAAKRASGR